MRAVLTRFQPGSRQPLPIETIGAHPQLAALLALWSRSCREDGLPARPDPLDIPRRLLPYLILVDIETAPYRLRVRLAGTRLCEVFGQEMRGLALEDMFEAEGAAEILAHTRHMIDRPAPHLATRTQARVGAGSWSYTRLILPLSHAGWAVDQLLLAIDPETFRHHPADVAPHG